MKRHCSIIEPQIWGGGFRHRSAEGNFGTVSETPEPPMIEIHTTKVKTQDGKIYDLGKLEYPPTHYHPGQAPCPECFVINAYTERIK